MNTQEFIIAAKAGDSGAFTKLVESHQNLALGYAYSKLGDFHRAQDVVQESFIVAFSKLDQLEDPLAFSGWLRGIVHHRCHRVFRMNLREWSPIEDHFEELTTGESLTDDLQMNQERRHLLEAIKGLPEQQRTVVTLFYLEEQSQKSVADFLDLPVTKINNYLHEARQHLKGRLLEMAGDTFREQRLSEEFAKNIGEIVSVQGPLVETKVKKSEQTKVFDVLGSKTSADKAGSDLIVVQRMKDGRYRCISTGNDIADKGKLYHSGQTENAFKALTENKIKEAVNSIVSKGEKPLLETGIKVLDLLCPFKKGGSIGIFGREGVGRAVMVMELLKRKAEIPGEMALFFFVDRWHVLGTQDLLDTEFRGELGISSDVNDNVQTAWIVSDRAGNPNSAKEADYLDARIYFSPLKAIQNLWPCVDPLYCHSNALTEDLVGAEHFEVATRTMDCLKKAHDLMLDPVYLEMVALGARKEAALRKAEFTKTRLAELSADERQTVDQGMRLDRFFTQPFVVAEAITGLKGVAVPLKDTISGAKRILDGEFDRADLEDLTMKGSI